MERGRARSYGQAMTDSTILIGVDGSERSEDAIAFGGRIAAASGAQVIVACAFPYSRAYGYATLRDAALDTAHAMSRKLEGVPAQQISIRAPAASPARGLHELAITTRASLVVVGSTHTGHLGRVFPGSTGEKLLHGAPCAVAVVPRGYAEQPIGTVGVAYDGSDEANAALDSAVNLARAFGAELELIGVAASDWYTGPAIAGGVGVDVLRVEIEQAGAREPGDRGPRPAARHHDRPAHGRPGRGARRAQRRARPAGDRLARLRPAAHA